MVESVRSPRSIAVPSAAGGSTAVLACVLVFGVLVGSARSGPEAPPLDPLGTTEDSRPMADLTVLYEDFEGTFPGAWTVEDRDEWNGVDHWGSTAYRAFAGTSSAWSAAVGTQVLAPETIWYEDFEGSFPGTNWTVWDSNPAGGDDHWGVKIGRAHV